MKKLLTLDLTHHLDPVVFAEEALKYALDPWQKKALRWAGKKMIMCCSRQSGKSTVSAIIAAHRALFFPKSLTLLVSPSQRQSSELFKKVIDELSKLPDQPKRVEDNKLSITLATGSRIVSLPSTEATVRGYSGASLIVIDEASRVPDQLYYSLSPMVAVSGGQMLLLSTPAGKRGFYHQAWISDDDEWEKISVTAEECPRISDKFLEQEKKNIGDFWFKQEYLCEFLEAEGSLFSYEEIEDAFTDDFEGWDISLRRL